MTAGLGALAVLGLLALVAAGCIVLDMRDMRRKRAALDMWVEYGRERAEHERRLRTGGRP